MARRSSSYGFEKGPVGHGQRQWVLGCLCLMAILGLMWFPLALAEGESSNINVVEGGDSQSLDFDVPPATIISGEEFRRLHQLGEEPLLIQFFAPWCGACKTFAPFWEDLEFLLRTEEVDEAQGMWKGVIGKIDCSQHQAICDEYKINRYPTVRLFNKDLVSEYNGDRYDLEALWYFAAEPKPDAFVPFETNPPEEVERIGRLRKEGLERERSGIQVPDASNVRVFDSEDDSTVLAALQSGWWLVEFHIGGGFAADIQADFSRASEQLGQLHSGRLSVGKINVFPREVIKRHFELTSFPQVMLLQDGNQVGLLRGSREINYDNLLKLVADHLPANSKDEL